MRGLSVARKAIAALLAMLAVLSLEAAGQAAEPLPFQAADLFSLEFATDPQISPDGRWIAYVRRSADIMSDRFRSAIWMIDSRSGAEQPIAAGPGNASQPRWSHDGSRLAFLSSGEGGAPQIVVRWLATGASVKITNLADAPANLAWSPDDRAIAFTAFVRGSAPKLGSVPAKPAGANWAPTVELYDRLTYRTDDEGYLKPGFTHIFLLPATGGAVRQLTAGEVHDAGPLSWTPDGKRILFSANRRADWEFAGYESDIYALDVASGLLAALTSRKGPDNQPSVSPDGRWIAFTGFNDDEHPYHNDEIYLMSSSGGVARSLTASLDRAVNAIAWAHDSRSIYFSYDDRGSRRVANVSLAGQRREVMSGLAGTFIDRPYAGGAFTIAANGTLAATTGNALHPADVSIGSPRGTRQLTHLNAFLAERRLPEVRKLSALRPDGLAIDAWLTLPVDYRQGSASPLILEIHGGPHNAYGPNFSFDDLLYSAAGFAVLSVNPRGSTSYGADFASRIFHAFPGKDADDLLAAVDEAVRQGYADPERLFVTGGSGGGILAAWLIGKTNRFRAAAVQKPAVDMASFVLTADQPDFYSRYWFGKFPWEDPSGFWSRSPLSQAGQIRTPTLIIVGDQDFRTPPSEAEQLYTALRLQKVPAMLMKVPGAGHLSLVSRPSQNAARTAAIIDWFERYDRAGKNGTFDFPALRARSSR